MRIKANASFRLTVCAVVFALGTSVSLAVAPVASDVTMAQDPDRRVTITYKLDQSAVVTVDIETNVVGTAEWASIGLGNVTHMTGEANRLVEVSDPTAVHTVYWNPDASWPGHVVNRRGTRAVVKTWATNSPPDWMLVNCTQQKSISYYEAVAQLPFGDPTNTPYKTDWLLLRKVHAAGQTFNRGIAYADRSVYNGWYYGARPSRRNSFTADYYLAIYKLTTRQFSLLTGTAVTDAKKGKCSEPVDECPMPELDYCTSRGTPDGSYDWPHCKHVVSSTSHLGKIRTFTGVDFDFPTDAQWEFACRAGEDRLRYDGANDPEADGCGDLDWYAGNIPDASKPYQPVGFPKKPNAWGFYNLYANGREFVLDKFYANQIDYTEVDPTGIAGTLGDRPNRVYRGGINESAAKSFFSAYSEKYSDWQGIACIRLCAPAVAK